jgi:hypothetical protein
MAKQQKYDFTPPRAWADRLRLGAIGAAGAAIAAALTKWILSRLKRPVAAPDLTSAGYRLIRGRLAATPDGPAGLFLVENAQGVRLAVCVRAMGEADRNAAMVDNRFEGVQQALSRPEGEEIPRLRVGVSGRAPCENPEWRDLSEDWFDFPADAITLDPLSGDASQIPVELLQHRAVLTRPDGAPFSEVVETYTREILDFAAPTPRERDPCDFAELHGNKSAAAASLQSTRSRDE